MSLDLSATFNGCTWPETDVKQTYTYTYKWLTECSDSPQNEWH
jgi:hypothetical protein